MSKITNKTAQNNTVSHGLKSRDSDSGSSVHCGRAGSSPASPTKKYRHTSVCLYFFVFGVVDEDAFILRDPNETQQSGFVGKRSRSKMSKFFRLRRNEGYVACGDAVPPRPPKRQSKGCLFFCQSILAKTVKAPGIPNEKEVQGLFCLL